MGSELDQIAVQKPANHPNARVNAFKDLLSRDVVDLDALRTLTFAGVPEDEKSLRAVVWKLLLNYLPPERAAWDRTIARKRQEYSTFCQELIIDPKSLAGRPPEDLNSSCLTSNPLLPTAAVERSTVAVEDHPLSVSDDSKWRIYFADAEIREQILRDVERTHPDMHFFSGNEPAVVARRAAMQRALFVYAKLNPGISYVQGMNELLAVIFYTLGSDPGVDVAAAEAASFYCLVELLGEFRDNFCKQLDNSEVGIRATLSRLSTSLRSFDSRLYKHLDVSLGLKPQFYAFRWITTLLTQEYAFPDVIRIWDSMLADRAGKSDCLMRICSAMVLHLREDLLRSDFATCMHLLQHYPPVDVGIVLEGAERLNSYKTVLVLDDEDNDEAGFDG